MSIIHDLGLIYVLVCHTQLHLHRISSARLESCTTQAVEICVRQWLLLKAVQYLLQDRRRTDLEFDSRKRHASLRYTGVI
jgi:hypothetical protein